MIYNDYDFTILNGLFQYTTTEKYFRKTQRYTICFRGWWCFRPQGKYSRVFLWGPNGLWSEKVIKWYGSFRQLTANTGDYCQLFQRNFDNWQPKHLTTVNFSKESLYPSGKDNEYPRCTDSPKMLTRSISWFWHVSYSLLVDESRKEIVTSGTFVCICFLWVYTSHIWDVFFVLLYISYET